MDNPKYETFPNAPIREALLDIGVELDKDFDVNRFNKIYKTLKDRFPNVKKRKHFVDIEAKSIDGNLEYDKTYHDDKLVGFLYISENENKYVQYRLDGFSYNILTPYSNWESFKLEAQELWKLYTQITGNHIKINRLALRYINEFQIPIGEAPVTSYIMTFPHVATGINYPVSDFLMRLILVNEDLKALGIITETIGKTTEDTMLPIVFDIDVNKNCNSELDQIDIWEILDNLRDFKNDIFFKSITDKAKEKFRIGKTE